MSGTFTQLETRSERWNFSGDSRPKNIIVQVGVSVQCPTGESCLAEFRELEIGENPYEDIRNLRWVSEWGDSKESLRFRVNSQWHL